MLEIVGEIYEAALQPELWPKVLERIATLLNGAVTVLMAHDSGNSALTIGSAVRFDEAYRREYNEHFSSRNIWAIRGKQFIRPGVVYTSEMACEKEELERSEYYQDFLRRLGISYALGGSFTSNSGDLSMLSTTGLTRRGPFGPAEMEIFQLLLPHFRRAIQMHSRIAVLEEERNHALGALDRLPCGCILIASCGKTVHVNAAGAKILQAGDGLKVIKEALVATNRQESERLQSILVRVVQTGLRLSLAPGESIAISRSSMKTPYSVLVVPITSPEWKMGRQRVAAAVFVTDPEAAPPDTEGALREWFGLTKAEARLAQALLHGGGLKQAADLAGISSNTAKTHLQRIFQKTNTRSQSELVRLIVSTPSVFV